MADIEQHLCFVLDKSGSMNEWACGVSKTTFAAVAANKFMKLAKPSSDIKQPSIIHAQKALDTATGSLWDCLIHCVHLIGKSASISYDSLSAMTFSDEIDLILPQSTINKETLESLYTSLETVNPNGATALYTAIRNAINSHTGGILHVLIVTDGKDNMSSPEDIDACSAIVQQLRQDGQLQLGLVAIMPEGQHDEMYTSLKRVLDIQDNELAMIDRTNMTPKSVLHAIIDMIRRMTQTTVQTTVRASRSLRDRGGVRGLTRTFKNRLSRK